LWNIKLERSIKNKWLKIIILLYKLALLLSNYIRREFWGLGKIITFFKIEIISKI
jgi:hypothetical protein